MVAFGTVLSPQYNVWFAPVVLLGSAGRPTQGRLGALVSGIALVTHLLWPYAYSDLLEGDIWASALLLARNLALVALAVLLWRATFMTMPGGTVVSDQPGRTAPATGME